MAGAGGVGRTVSINLAVPGRKKRDNSYYGSKDMVCKTPERCEMERSRAVKFESKLPMGRKRGRERYDTGILIDRYRMSKRAKQDAIILHTPGKEEKPSIYTHPLTPFFEEGWETRTHALSHTFLLGLVPR